MTIENGMVLGAMVVMSIVDIKKRQVSLKMLIPFGLAVICWRIFQGAGFGELLAGLVPGVLCLLLSYVTEESIGTGDGLVLCALGIFCGIKAAVAILGMALVLSAVWAMVLLIFKKAGRKTELPFLPCLSIGYLFCILG